MNRQWITKSKLRNIALSAVFGAVAVVAAGGGAASGAASAAASGAPSDAANLDAPAATRVYSVVNLAPSSAVTALLNERGQAAFLSVNFDGVQTGFFDGERITPIAGLGGSYTWIRSLNNNGVVAGESLSNAYPNRRILAFTWSLAGGPRELPGQSVASANDINDSGVSVGRTGAPGLSGRAARWNPDGTLVPLGPLPTVLSEAYEINGAGHAAGYTSYAGATFRASLWAPDGTLTDLGTLGGDYAFGAHINERGDVAGTAQAPGRDRNLGFFWSAAAGMLPIDIRGGSVLNVADLNNQGEVALGAVVEQRRSAWLWSGRRGAVRLPTGDALQSDVADLNNRNELVGDIELQGDNGETRAVRWPGVNPPIDLNTRLYRAPAGLVLQAGAAINDQGTILAQSNAGLVLLRPGTRGTDAPVLGPIRGMPDAVVVGQQLDLAVGFVDNGAYQRHTAAVAVADGCPSSVPLVSASGGVGEVRLRHTFCKAGLYAVRVRVSDSGGRSTDVLRDIVVEQPGIVLRR